MRQTELIDIILMVIVNGIIIISILHNSVGIVFVNRKLIPFDDFIGGECTYLEQLHWHRRRNLHFRRCIATTGTRQCDFGRKGSASSWTGAGVLRAVPQPRMKAKDNRTILIEVEGVVQLLLSVIVEEVASS